MAIVDRGETASVGAVVAAHGRFVLSKMQVVAGSGGQTQWEDSNQLLYFVNIKKYKPFAAEATAQHQGLSSNPSRPQPSPIIS